VRSHAGLPREEERVPLRGLRKRIAERMVQSAFSAPHVTAMEEADVTDLVALRARAQEVADARGTKLTFLPFIVKAVVTALKTHPFLNASLDPQAGVVVLKRYYHIGIATATEEGLLVPVIRDADKKDLWDIARELARLTEAARARTIGHDDLHGSTFTISNYGAFGGLFATPIINPPEVAILGVGRIQDRPVVRDGHIVVRKLMGVSLSFDHRAVDGDGAGRFLSQVLESLETPDRMTLSL
jgi:pyruvate dehydrogenase E2 component (dihydrolipoamide acetyltransferase)